MAQQLDPAIFGESRSRATCAVDGCGRPRNNGTLCGAHHQRKLRGTPMDEPIRKRRKKHEGPRACCAPGCYREAAALGMCHAHYRRHLKGRSSEAPIQARRSTDLTVDFGVRILRTSVDVLTRQARTMRVSRSALIGIILEQWAETVTARKREAA